MRRRGTCRLAAMALGICVSCLPATAQATSSRAEIEASVSSGANYLKSLQLASGGFESDWDLSALAASGVAAANVKKTGAATDARTWYRELVGNETATKWPPKAIATEYERASLNAYAAGIEPATVSRTQNLVAGILSFYQPEHPGYYGEPEVFEGTIFGLLALADAKTEEGVQRVPGALLEQSIATIDANQHTDGGWNYQKAEGNETIRKSAAEPDTTGAAIAALCAAGASPSSEAVEKGLSYLKSLLANTSGAFESEPNTDSNAWAVSGLNVCAVNPQEPGFTTAAGKTPIDFLISQQLAGGGYRYLSSGSAANEYASQDAVRALAGAGFTAAPPVPSGGLEQWFATSGFSTAKGVKSPLGLVINNGTGTLKACSVPVAPETATTTLEAVLKAAEAGSTPTGCVTGHAAEGSTQAITQINGYPSMPTPAWKIGIDGGKEAQANLTTTIHLGDTIYLRYAPAPANPPTVVTKAAESATQTAATLKASVNPEGTEVTDCEFEYGETSSYGKTASCATLPGKGTEPVSVSTALTSLTANKTYHFRIVATNAGGTSRGADETFKTLPNVPAAVTEKASSIGTTTVTLNATVNPEGGEVTKCEFEYGETVLYGKTVSCSSLPGSGNGPVAVSAPLSGLPEATTFHFRISATNGGGGAQGADQSFMTLSAGLLPPHWFSGVGGSSSQYPPTSDRLGEGKVVQTLTWGTAADLVQESSGGSIGCRTVGAGSVENPKGSGSEKGEKGPAGVQRIQLDEYYDCGGTCEAQVAAAKGPGGVLEGVPGEGAPSAVAEGMPWSGGLVSQPANGSSGIEESIGAPPGTAGEMLESVYCEVEPNPEKIESPSGSGKFPYAGKHVFSSSRFEGELRPSVGPGFNGGGTVANPAYEHFTSSPLSPEYSGELLSPGQAPGAGQHEEGNVKIEGYEGASLLRARSG